MRLYLKNIGKLKEADIQLDGITVIAGENNTGKSTVGKALYSVYNSFHHFDSRLQYTAQIEIMELGTKDYPHIVFPSREDDYELYMKYFSGSNEITLEQKKAIYLEVFQHNNSGIPSDILEDVTDEFVEIISVTDEDLAKQYLNLSIEGEFSGQISHLFNEEESILQLTEEREYEMKVARFTVVDNEIQSFEGFLNFSHEAIYMDDPLLLDDFFKEKHDNFHRKSLKNQLLKYPEKDQALTQILAEKRLKKILTLIHTVCEGDLSFQNTVTYRMDKTGKSFEIKNLSTGVKSFAILKRLLKNGALSRGSVLILDEPEIHLHPEWQLVYAELIVLLQKEFKLTILLTTHSPYFLRALEVYAGKHAVADKCHYYLAKNVGNEAEIVDVTENRDEIYKKLSRPLRDLENERLEIDD